MLGGADGFSVLRRFKAELPETKVVLMTGHGNSSAGLAGADWKLSKGKGRPGR